MIPTTWLNVNSIEAIPAPRPTDLQSTVIPVRRIFDSHFNRKNIKMDRPPSYRRSSEDIPEDLPPEYETAITEAYVPEETPNLILDDCTIYSRAKPERPLYKISNPVCESSNCTIYGVQKFRYRVRSLEGEQRLRSRLDHIYDFKGDWLSVGHRDIIIEPKSSRKRVHHDVKMATLISVMSYKVPGHFKVERSLRDRMKKGHEMEWKDTEGNLVAVETRPDRNDDGELLTKPELEIKKSLDEKDLDLLVTCWLARVWQQTERDLKGTMTWEKCKCREDLLFTYLIIYGANSNQQSKILHPKIPERERIPWARWVLSFRKKLMPQL